MPLPLFPRLIDSFVQQEASTIKSGDRSLLSQILATVEQIRQWLFQHSAVPISTQNNHRWNLTLLGGLLGVLFSACQAISSPLLGRFADKHGRKPTLLLSMIGNIVSALLWLLSGNFELYAASRIIGGLSEGNVQLSIAIITDVTLPSQRSRSLALVGAAFSIAFVFGPPLGAWFAQKTFSTASNWTVLGYAIKLNVYAVPAAMTLALLIFETILLAIKLPETKDWNLSSAEGKQEKPDESKQDFEDSQARAQDVTERLRSLGLIHFGFLLFFSGAEYALTFVTFTLFDYSNLQNGRLLGYIGLVSSLLQGGYVRRQRNSQVPEKGPIRLASSGIWSSAVALALLAYLPRIAGAQDSSSLISPKVVLYAAATLLAYTSATVVTSLTSLASLAIDSTAVAEFNGETRSSDKAAKLGSFRSRGQIGRALGPLVATSMFWIWGPQVAYSFAAFGTAIVGWKFSQLSRQPNAKVKNA
ncbi:hypothetical protein OIO90_006563 [Microbotryomycetes sp. JL221]|nr:hypothetical protein OIO90_006563 [Microbotryomycetes sp. JL221]